MKVSKEVPSCSKLHSLLGNELSNIALTLRNGAWLQSTEKTPEYTFHLGSHAANIVLTSSFFCFLDMSLIQMIRNGTLDTIPRKRFDSLPYWDAFMDAYVEKVVRYPALVQNRTELIGCTIKWIIGDGAEKKNYLLIDLLSSKTESAAKQFDDSSIPRDGRCCHNEHNTKRTSFHLKESKSKKSQHSSAPISFPENETAYNTSKHSPEYESSYRYNGLRRCTKT